MTVPDIFIKNATLVYANTTVFSDLNVHFPAHQWIGILGKSGIGKSSLLRMIAGLIPATETNATVFSSNGIAPHKQVAYMAQSDLLLPWMTVLDNALLGVKLRPRTKISKHQSIIRVKKILEQVGLGTVIHHYPYQLSGGMRQRVSLVRTLMEDKPIILMDEPFSALDTITRYHLQALAVEWLKEKTVIFITHDPGEALRLANYIYIMQNQPAALTCLAQLHSPCPREVNHPDVLKWQPLLFQSLSTEERKSQ